MIFSFTEEEKELIRDFEKKARAQGITSDDIKRDIADVEEDGEGGLKVRYEERKKENLIKTVCNDFIEMINSFENARFSELDNQTKIIENAKSTAEEAIIFIYNSFNFGDIKANSDSFFTISNFTYSTKNHFYIMFNEGISQLFNYHVEQAKPPARIFEKSGMREFLFQYAIKKHIEALEGTPGAEVLEEIIDSILDGSFYIIPDEDKQEPPFVVENSGVNRKYVDTSKYTAMNSLVSAQMVSKSPKPSKKDIPGQYTMQWDIIEKEVVYVATIDFVNDNNVYINAKIDAYDMAIINAVGSLYIAHQAQEPGEFCYLTPMDIWRFMNGKEANEKIKITPNQEKHLLAHIDKLRFTKFEIDLKSQMKKWGISFDSRYTQKTGKADDAILNLTGVQIYTSKNKKQSTYGYRVNTEPILFTYSRYRKQIITVDKSLLNVTDNKTLGENTIVFKNYLLKRIENYKHGYLSSNVIKLETIYRETGIKEPGQREKEENHTNKAAYLSAIRKERAKDCKEIEHIFKTWEAAKYIKGYTKEGQGNEVYYIFETDKHPKPKRLK